MSQRFDHYDDEPFLNEHDWTELGCEFEQKIFGGNVGSINKRVDCAYGLYVSDLNKPMTYWSIPMDYIHKIQQEDTRADPRILEGKKGLHIPKDGARTCNNTTFSIQMWDDEADLKLADVVDFGTKPPNRGKCDTRLERVVHGRVEKVKRT